MKKHNLLNFSMLPARSHSFCNFYVIRDLTIHVFPHAYTGVKLKILSDLGKVLLNIFKIIVIFLYSDSQHFNENYEGKNCLFF